MHLFNMLLDAENQWNFDWTHFLARISEVLNKSNFISVKVDSFDL